MSMPNYSLVKGRVTKTLQATKRDDHFHLLVEANEAGNILTNYRVTINVQSNNGSEVFYCKNDDLKIPLLDRLPSVPEGLLPLPVGSNLRLDYTRGRKMFDPANMRQLPAMKTADDNVNLIPLNDGEPDFNDLFSKLFGDFEQSNAVIHAFGQSWRPDPEDAKFHFRPGRGIHRIHMNQNDPVDGHLNGPWQDGALIVHLDDHWEGLFFHFKGQLPEETSSDDDESSSRPDSELMLMM